MPGYKENKFGIYMSSTWSLTWKTLFMAFMLGLFVFFAEKVTDAVLPKDVSIWVFLLMMLILAIIIGVMLFFSIKSINRQVSVSAHSFDAKEIVDRPYLICGYSPIEEEKNGKIIETGPLHLDFGTFTSELDDACTKDKWFVELGSWQQNLRVLNALKYVERLYVINPDTDQFEDFEKLIRHFFPENIQNDKRKLEVILVTDKKDNSTTLKRGYHDEGLKPDYENFEYVTASISRALEMIAHDTKKPMHDIEAQTSIDITAGFKTFSVAAAIMSLNRNLVFLYTGTKEKQNIVIGYDAEIHLFQQNRS